MNTGFREAFLGHSLEVLQSARTSPGTEQQGMGMQPVSLGRVRSRARQGERMPREGQLLPSPLCCIILLIYHIIHLLIHSFISSVNILHVTDTAPCPRDKMVSKRSTLPTPLQPRS